MTIHLYTALPLEAALRWLARCLLIAGLGGIATYLWSEADRKVHGAAAWEEFQIVKPSPLGPPVAVEEVPFEAAIAASEPAPVSGAEPSSSIDAGVIARIEIPAVALKAVVRSGVDARTLRRSVGHLPGTVLPGEIGNSVLAGHRDSDFSPLRQIERGDLIRVQLTSGHTVVYRVDQMAIVEPDAVSVLAPSATPRLTLVTCYPFGFLGPSPRRFIVGAAAADP